MKKPDIFSDKTPSVFSSSSKFAQCKRDFDQWLPEFEGYCKNAGLLGQRLMEEFPETGCKAVLDCDQFNEITNDLLGGHYSPRDNEIHIGLASLGSKEALFHILFHESIHALQYHNCASCSANMSYSSLPIALSPMDQITQIILEERDAWVKTRYFFYGFNTEIPIDSPAYLEALREDIVESSVNILADETHDDGLNFHEWYINYALAYYEDIVTWHKEYGETDFEYVKLDKTDAWKMDNTLKINSFFEREEHVQYPIDIKFTDEQKRRIAALEDVLGIEDNMSLRTLSEAIKDRGVDYETYLKNNLEKIREDNDN